jgi:hypothetical protein
MQLMTANERLRSILLMAGIVGVTAALEVGFGLGWNAFSIVVFAICAALLILGAILAKGAIGVGLLGGSILSAARILTNIVRGTTSLDAVLTVCLLLLTVIIAIGGYIIMRHERKVSGAPK